MIITIFIKTILFFIFFEIVLFTLPSLLFIMAFIVSRRHRSRLLENSSIALKKSRKIINEYIYLSIKRFFYTIKGNKNSINKILSKEDLYNTLIDNSPEDFEVFCEKIYKKLGYKTILSPPGRDGGKDVIAINDTTKIYIECKRYNRNATSEIGRDICKKLVGSCIADNVSHGIVFTTGNINNLAYEYKDELNKTGKFLLEFVDYNKIYDLYLSTFKPINNLNITEYSHLSPKIKKILVSLVLILTVIGMINFFDGKETNSVAILNTSYNLQEKSSVTFDELNCIIKFNDLTFKNNSLQLSAELENNSEKVLDLSNFTISIITANKREIINTKYIIGSVKPNTIKDFVCKFSNESLKNTPIKVFIEYKDYYNNTSIKKELELISDNSTDNF